MADRIEILDRPSNELFQSKSEKGTIPVLVTNAMNGWAAREAWTIDLFRKRFGELEVPVGRSHDGVIRGDPGTGFTNAVEVMKMGSFLDLIEERVQSACKYYLVQLPLKGPFAALASEVSVPLYIEGRKIRALNLWLGPADVVSPLHFDGADNLFCQVLGQKRFVMFPPKETERLYPFSCDSRIPYMSQVDIDNPDLGKFPNFSQAEKLEVRLSAGDMIYIPCGWWHQVYSLSQSISVNFWF